MTSLAPLAALQYRDFRLLWCGQLLSMIGTRMQAVALLWHLFRLTESEFAMGGIGLARVVPLVAFALLGGMLADAMDRRRVMLVSQTVLALVSLVLGFWTLAGLTMAWPLYATAALSAAATAFDGPARQSLLPSLVPRERLSNAVSLNSLTMQLASILGPAMMGLILARASVGWVYLVNAGSFLGVIGALLVMKPLPASNAPRPRVGLGALREGIHYLRHSPLLISLMLLDFAATLFASATVLLPVLAERELRLDAGGYGFLASAASVGALVGAGAMTLAPNPRRQGWLVVGAVLVYGAATVGFGFAATFWECFGWLAITGAADTVSTVIRSTLRQLATPDELRGRMTAMNMIFFQGGPQLGEVEAGLVAGWFGVRFSIISGGLACIAAALLTAWKSPALRKHDVIPTE